MAKFNPLPEAEYLHECFSYYPDTGELYWKVRPVHHFSNQKTCNVWNGRLAGEVAGSLNDAGYLIINLVIGGGQQPHRAHRIIWKMQTGEEPVGEVDHENRRRADNRWDNLRPASHGQNMQNVASKRQGMKGVTLDKRFGTFHAKIYVNGKNTYLGGFHAEEEAHAAYCKAASAHFGEFWSAG